MVESTLQLGLAAVKYYRSRLELMPNPVFQGGHGFNVVGLCDGMNQCEGISVDGMSI